MNNIQYIGATLTGVAALATASVTVYNTFLDQGKTESTQTRVGIIYDKDGWTYLRQLPSTNSTALTRLANNVEVTIINDSGNWFQIQTRNNKIGFVYKNNILEQ